MTKIKIPKGFTLIETLIAVFLLITAIAGPLTIASKGLTATQVAKDQFIAFYLAQDAMEQVRFMRDSACLAAGIQTGGCPTGTWLASLDECVSTDLSRACIMDTTKAPTDIDAIVTCGSVTTCATMNYNTVTNQFTYSGGTPTTQRFKRSIQIKRAAGADEALVVVEVSWTTIAGVTRAPVVVREQIFRWQ
jgi:Tfp pilus assembly protein PilV